MSRPSDPAAAAPPTGAGGVRPLAFLKVTAPATVASLAVGALVLLGYIQVVITTAHPIVMATSGGTADEMLLGVDSVAGVVGRDDAHAGDQSAARVQLAEGRLENLCLIPTIDVPLIGRRLSIRLATSRPVRLPEASLAVTGGNVEDFGAPQTTIGAAQGSGDAAGAFTVFTEPSPDAVRLGRTDMSAHGIVLDGGLRLSSLTARPSFGTLAC